MNKISSKRLFQYGQPMFRVLQEIFSLQKSFILIIILMDFFCMPSIAVLRGINVELGIIKVCVTLRDVEINPNTCCCLTILQNISLQAILNFVAHLTSTTKSKIGNI